MNYLYFNLFETWAVSLLFTCFFFFFFFSLFCSYSGVDSGLDASKGLFLNDFYPLFKWLYDVKRLANVDTARTRGRSVFVLHLLLGERQKVPLPTYLKQVNGTWAPGYVVSIIWPSCRCRLAALTFKTSPWLRLLAKL